MSVRENIELWGDIDGERYVHTLVVEYGAVRHPAEKRAYIVEGLPFYSPGSIAGPCVQPWLTKSSTAACPEALSSGEMLHRPSRLSNERSATYRKVWNGMSGREYHRVLGPAPGIADLAGCETVQAADLAEALQYRPKSPE